MIKKIAYTLFCLLTVAACKIENDIPYPTVEGSILSMEVEGQCAGTGENSASATINANKRTVQLYVDDSVDLTKLRITKLTVSNDAQLIPDKTVCNAADKFPSVGFESLDALGSSVDTQVDFSKPVAFTLRTLCARLRFKSSRSISNASAIIPLVMSCSTHLVKSLRAI